MLSESKRINELKFPLKWSDNQYFFIISGGTQVS